jgi:peptide-methionine (R)-S-oxide reductase
MMTRRVLIAGGAASLTAPVWLSTNSSACGGADIFPVILSDAEWRERLTPDQHEVLRGNGIERPFTSPLLHEKRRGNFSCAGCDLDLFLSTTKFESGTGWPSFWAPLDDAVGGAEDKGFGVVRTAVHCRRCGGHLGHVFKDGPQRTGLRYCMNGVALSFKPVVA